jgi:hypothetical protein
MLFRFTSLTLSQLSSLVSTGPPTSTMPTLFVQNVDQAKCQDASIDYRSNVIRAGHISSDRLADAAFRFDDLLGLERRIDIDIGYEDLCSFTGEEHRRRLAVAPTWAARACSRNKRHPLFEPIAYAFLPMAGGRDACALALPRYSDM